MAYHEAMLFTDAGNANRGGGRRFYGQSDFPGASGKREVTA
jgi:hypothetical protein